MATVNISKQFKSLLPEVIRFRGIIETVNEPLMRVKVKWGSSSIWVTATTGLSIGDQVLVEGNKVISRLPELEYLSTEI